jgi:hypothetical protein
MPGAGGVARRWARRSARPWLAALLLLYVVVCVITQPGPGAVNDEGAMLAGADRLAEGRYAVRGADHVAYLWHGPGMPLLLAPLRALDVPLPAIRVLVGPLLLFAALVVFHRALRLHLAPGAALAGTLALGLYGPAMQPLRTVHKEPLAMLLVAAAMLFAGRGIARGRRRDLLLAGLALGALVMVRLEYGWGLMALLGLCAVWAVRARDRARPRRAAAVLAIGLGACLPWLAYTHEVSGRIAYWGNAGGESLFWMSPTGVPGETGEFHGVRTVFRDPALAPYRPLLRRLERLAPLDRDLALQRLARANMTAHPREYARNVAANSARLWFLVPTRPAPPAGTVLLYATFNGALLLACGWALLAVLRRRPVMPPEAPALLAFAVVGVALHVPPSADPRMLLPVVPVLVWLVLMTRPWSTALPGLVGATGAGTEWGTGGGTAGRAAKMPGMRLLVFDDPSLQRRYEWLVDDSEAHEAMRALAKQAYRGNRRRLPDDKLEDHLRAYGTIDARPYVPPSAA